MKDNKELIERIDNALHDTLDIHQWTLLRDCKEKVYEQELKIDNLEDEVDRQVETNTQLRSELSEQVDTVDFILWFTNSLSTKEKILADIELYKQFKKERE